MTKLHPAVAPNCDNVTLSPDTRQNDRINHILPDSDSSSQIDQSNGTNDARDNGVESSSESDDNYEEPLGYQDFLYDVNIEYSPGGNRSSPSGNKYCFKMKCLPYMVVCNNSGSSHDSWNGGSSSDIASCDKEDTSENSILNDQTVDLTSLTSMSQIDVTKETCAFLSNSDFVPSLKNKARRVTLELVSAKLSQSSGYHIPPNSSLSNLTSLAENQPNAIHSSPDNLSINSYGSHNSMSVSNHEPRSQASSIAHLKIAPPPPPTSPSSSKKFVNYTILIKTMPGLDRHPAVIERRFSDFLSLYQGLKNEKKYADLVDQYVMFPKKVYMGNFSLEKIAERSIEFTRLLNICMVNTQLTWSVPFISFLVDRELKEAHRLSLFGDPDDVQALIENAYYIEQKLYFKLGASSRGTSSTSSLSLSNCNSPAPPIRGAPASPSQTRGNQTISTYNIDNNAHQQLNQDANSFMVSSSSSNRDSVVELGNIERRSLTPINQRILVTFCMLFVTYCRSQNHQGLKQAVGEFSQLISSQEYVDSLINTRHYHSLRACLLFLMNLNHGDVVDENLRMVMKRKLEDIDGIHAELNDKIAASLSSSRSSNAYSPRGRRLSTKVDDIDNMTPGRGPSRVTKKDLTSLLRDRHFCSFQDGKVSL